MKISLSITLLQFIYPITIKNIITQSRHSHIQKVQLKKKKIGNCCFKKFLKQSVLRMSSQSQQLQASKRFSPMKFTKSTKQRLCGYTLSHPHPSNSLSQSPSTSPFPCQSPSANKLSTPNYFCHLTNSLYMGGMQCYKRSGHGLIFLDNGTCVLTNYSYDNLVEYSLIVRGGALTVIRHGIGDKGKGSGGTRGKGKMVGYRGGSYLFIYQIGELGKANGIGYLVDFGVNRLYKLNFYNNKLDGKKQVLERRILDNVLKNYVFSDIIQDYQMRELLEMKIQQRFGSLIRWESITDDSRKEDKQKNEIEADWEQCIVGFMEDDGNTVIPNGLVFRISVNKNPSNFSIVLRQRGYKQGIKMEKFGERHFQNGNYYIGGFKNNLFQGYGVLVHPEQNAWTYGIYKKGQLIQILKSSKTHSQSLPQLLSNMHKNTDSYIQSSPKFLSHSEVSSLLSLSISSPQTSQPIPDSREKAIKHFNNLKIIRDDYVQRQYEESTEKRIQQELEKDGRKGWRDYVGGLRIREEEWEEVKREEKKKVKEREQAKSKSKTKLAKNKNKLNKSAFSLNINNVNCCKQFLKDQNTPQNPSTRNLANSSKNQVKQLQSKPQVNKLQNSTNLVSGYPSLSSNANIDLSAYSNKPMSNNYTTHNTNNSNRQPISAKAAPSSGNSNSNKADISYQIRVKQPTPNSSNNELSLIKLQAIKEQKQFIPGYNYTDGDQRRFSSRSASGSQPRSQSTSRRKNNLSPNPVISSRNKKNDLNANTDFNTNANTSPNSNIPSSRTEQNPHSNIHSNSKPIYRNNNNHIAQSYKNSYRSSFYPFIYSYPENGDKNYTNTSKNVPKPQAVPYHGAGPVISRHYNKNGSNSQQISPLKKLLNSSISSNELSSQIQRIKKQRLGALSASSSSYWPVSGYLNSHPISFPVPAFSTQMPLPQYGPIDYLQQIQLQQIQLKRQKLHTELQMELENKMNLERQSFLRRQLEIQRKLERQLEWERQRERDLQIEMISRSKSRSRSNGSRDSSVDKNCLSRSRKFKYIDMSEELDKTEKIIEQRRKQFQSKLKGYSKS